jgi:hypothetical protein
MLPAYCPVGSKRHRRRVMYSLSSLLCNCFTGSKGGIITSVLRLLACRRQRVLCAGSHLCIAFLVARLRALLLSVYEQATIFLLSSLFFSFTNLKRRQMRRALTLLMGDTPTDKLISAMLGFTFLCKLSEHHGR